MVIGQHDTAEVKRKSALFLPLDIDERRKRKHKNRPQNEEEFVLGK